MVATPALTQRAFELAQQLAEQRHQSIDVVIEQSLEAQLTRSRAPKKGDVEGSEWIEYWMNATEIDPDVAKHLNEPTDPDIWLYDETGAPR